MAKIITIETSGGVASVALAIEGRCVAVRQEKGNEQTHRLTSFIDQILKDNNLSLTQDIDAVAVSAGPGSYTGLRIGVSLAKGLCLGAGKPLIAIGTLDALCVGATSLLRASYDYLIPMVDARRMEVYTAIYDKHREPLSEVEAMVVDGESFREFDQKVIFGSGAAKCAELIQAPLLEVELSGRWLCELAEKRYNEKKFEDIAYFEPSYIKDFVALTSQKKLF